MSKLITSESTAACEGDFRIVHNGHYYKVQRLKPRGILRIRLDWVDQPEIYQTVWEHLSNAKQYVDDKIDAMEDHQKQLLPFERVVSSEELK